MNNVKYISLYDFQGKRDVENIGKKVYKYAKYKKVKVKSRQLPGGLTVMTYPEEFLEDYFHTKRIVEELRKLKELAKLYF